MPRKEKGTKFRQVRKSVVRLLELDQAKSAVVNSLSTAKRGQVGQQTRIGYSKAAMRWSFAFETAMENTLKPGSRTCCNSAFVRRSTCGTFAMKKLRAPSRPTKPIGSWHTGPSPLTRSRLAGACLNHVSATNGQRL